ncbi:MAG: ATP-binding cassette domain-containing protein, partial [Gammaproteobacteria bacterium]|nr:ATP-binding cassette domain-containing protein [Gammaproteobacteria bacterium]NNJ83365.1 ATP-binding cassette domain-containing protein [Gammaproteobacteria bacterium]
VVLSNVTLRLSPGDRIGLLGANGSGKSTLIKTLTGELPLLGGKRTQAKDLRIGYFAQHQLEQLDPDASALTHLVRLSPNENQQALRNFLGSFAFSGDHATRPSQHFSGGEKARLSLALLIWQKPHLLFLDEPTNHLDINMRNAISLALQGYEGAVVLVSHDRYLLRATTDTFLLVNDGKTKPFVGDLEQYRDWLLMDTDRNEVSQGDKQVSQGKQRRSIKNKVRNLEQKMERLHVELADVARALTDDPDLDEQNWRIWLSRQTELRNALEKAEEAWLTASESLEAVE